MNIEDTAGRDDSDLIVVEESAPETDSVAAEPASSADASESDADAAEEGDEEDSSEPL